MTQSVEVLSEAVNCAVVRMPGRRFPGVVVQGDSLKIMTDLARDIHDEAQKCRNEELSALALELLNLLNARVQLYEAVLEANAIERPY